MAMMTVNADMQNYYVELTGQSVQVWPSAGGDAFYTGSLDALAIAHPAVIAELIQNRIIRSN
jgi:hypothetical protein